MTGPPASTAGVRSRMRLQKRRDTAPELALRRELHRRGLRYRVDLALLPGSRRRADVAFTRAKVAVFIHGCFWHACPIHGTRPVANAEWWQEKLERNVQRDRETRTQLEAVGWSVVELWEHDDPVSSAMRVEEVLRSTPNDKARRSGP